LVNDHWAVLPFIRGRSAIDYTVLFGFPVTATTHFVEPGVDSGGIIEVYRFDNIEKNASGLKQIRDVVRKSYESRAIDTLLLLSKSKKQTIENDTEKGLTFYSMHPDLIDFIERNIL
jgi:methionyl-tRNA formyltransferase